MNDQHASGRSRCPCDHCPTNPASAPHTSLYLNPSHSDVVSISIRISAPRLLRPRHDCLSTCRYCISIQTLYLFPEFHQQLPPDLLFPDLQKQHRLNLVHGPIGKHDLVTLHHPFNRPSRFGRPKQVSRVHAFIHERQELGEFDHALGAERVCKDKVESGPEEVQPMISVLISVPGRYGRRDWSEAGGARRSDGWSVLQRPVPVLEGDSAGNHIIER